MELKPYKSADIAEIAQLFYNTIHSVNAADYTEEQLAAWADGNPDLAAWDRSFREHVTIVAWENGEIVGFGDISSEGYLDRLYVHKDFQRRKIASAICDFLENSISSKRITTYASITAKPFFEARGYRAVRENIVERKGTVLKNYLMELGKRG